jgi:serine protease Do
MSMLDEIQATVTDVADKIGPSVVGIGRRGPRGSGVVVGEGLVLTNAHNLRREVAAVTFTDGRTEEGNVVAADYEADLAVVQVDTGEAPPIDRSETEPAAIGAPVVALSNPGGHGLRVTVGYVSGTERSFRGPKGRKIRGSLEHTAPLLPGSSGGPIVDRQGRLLGINTNRLGEGFYLAIPGGASLNKTIDRLAAGQTSGRVHLGVGVAPNEVAARLRQAVGLDAADGLLVRVVEDESPAAAAGIKEGDLLVSLAGNELATPDDLYAGLDAIDPGAAVPAVVRRADEVIELTVEFA